MAGRRRKRIEITVPMPGVRPVLGCLDRLGVSGCTIAPQAFAGPGNAVVIVAVAGEELARRIQQGFFDLLATTAGVLRLSDAGPAGGEHG